jgi:hypothetical protein
VGGGRQGEVGRREKIWGKEEAKKINNFQQGRMCFWFIPKITSTTSSSTSALVAPGSLLSGEDKVPLRISLRANVFPTFLFVFLKLCFGQTCYARMGIECIKHSTWVLVFVPSPKLQID